MRGSCRGFRVGKPSDKRGTFRLQVFRVRSFLAE
jgi:hypothetical protein